MASGEGPVGRGRVLSRTSLREPRIGKAPSKSAKPREWRDHYNRIYDFVEWQYAVKNGEHGDELADSLSFFKHDLIDDHINRPETTDNMREGFRLSKWDRIKAKSGHP